MSEWLTHVFVTWSIFEIISFRWKHLKRYRSLALLGSILPDIKNVGMFVSSATLDYLIFPLNSFASVLTISGIFVLMFVRRDLEESFLFLGGSACLHLLMDSLYWSWLGRLVPLYPFSLMKFGVNVFAHRSPILLPISFVLAVVVTVVCRKILNGSGEEMVRD